MSDFPRKKGNSEFKQFILLMNEQTIYNALFNVLEEHAGRFCGCWTNSRCFLLFSDLGYARWLLIVAWNILVSIQKRVPKWKKNSLKQLIKNNHFVKCWSIYVFRGCCGYYGPTNLLLRGIKTNILINSFNFQ